MICADHLWVVRDGLCRQIEDGFIQRWMRHPESEHQVHMKNLGTVAMAMFLFSIG
jgi:hypothetical protein